MQIPIYEESSLKLDRDERLNPLEIFILENEPSGEKKSDTFRDQLQAAIDFYTENTSNK